MNYSLDKLMKQVRGVSYSKNDATLTYKEGFVPVLRAGNIQNSRIIHDDFVYIPKEGVKNVQLLKKGDVLIAASSGSISIVGKAAMILQDMNAGFGAFCKVLRPNKEIVNEDYFKFYFETPHYKNTISQLAEGANINNLKTEHFDNLEIYLPPLPQQQKIANILDAADALRQNGKALIAKYDELTQALFLDMFGDPVSNPKGWDQLALKYFGKISTGNTPSRSDDANYSSRHIEWIKTDNIKENYLYITHASEYLSEVGLKKARTVEKDAILVACIAGSIDSIGRAALTDRKVSFNQQINAIESNSKVIPKYLYYLIRNCKKHIQNHASIGMKRMLTKGEFEKILMILPPLELQNQFAERVAEIEEQKVIAQKSLEKSESLFNSLLQKAFKGKLV